MTESSAATTEAGTVPGWVTNLRGAIDPRLYRVLARLSDGTELDEHDRSELLLAFQGLFRAR